MQFKFYLTSFLLILLLGFEVKSQGVLDLYVQEGLQNNQNLMVERLQTNLASEQTKSARQLFLPQLSFDASYLFAEGGRTIDFPVGDLFNPVYGTLNQLTASNQFPTNLENVNEQLIPNNFHETRLRLMLPILNTDIYYGYRASQKGQEVQEAKLAAMENQLEFEIRKSYYNHMQLFQKREILDSTRALIVSNLELSETLFSNGVITEDDVLLSKAQLSRLEAQKLEVDQQIMTSQLFFNFLLRRNLNDEIEKSSAIVLNEERDIIAAVDSAKTNRSELQQLSSAISAQEYLIKKERSYLIPTIGMGAELGYQGFNYTFDENQDYYLVNFQLSWALYNGGRNRSKIRMAELQKEQLEVQKASVESQIEVEVNAANFALNDAVLQHEANLAEETFQKKRLEIVSKKYAELDALQIEWHQALNDYTTARLKTAVSGYNILIARAHLNRTTQLNN